MEQFNVSDPQQGHDYRYAVCGRGMIKWYGKGKKKLEVLKRMDMTLEVGRIYGLLGPSGCGKTTFLKCVLGLMQLNEGSVKVFGRAPNTPGHNVPGIAVGYMPQELALYEEFTIEENFRFYAKIYGIDNESFNERTQHLVEFLDLPSKDRPCRALSGGQKRRVSLACALFHNPKLLILDEPTVGVDPLLRSKIWNYLVQLAQEGTSIIITTHYIEEARQADCVGLMRFGHLLAEGKPEQLMAEYHKKTLEDVFLELCVKQDNAQNADDAEENKALLRHAKPDRRGELEYSSNGLSSSVRSHHHLLHDDNEPTSPMSATSSVGPGMVYHAKHESASPMRPSVRATATGRRGSDDESGAPLLADGTDSSGSLAHQRAPLQDEPELEGSGAKESCYSYWCPRRNQTWAVVWKAFKGMQRNIAFLVFQFLLPSIQVALFCLAIGKDPTDLNIAITNLDQGLSLPLANCTIPASAQGLSSHPFPSSHWARGLIGSGSEAGFRGDSSVINLGALFVTKIPSSLNVKLYSNFDDAVASTHAGKTWGSVFIPANFSVDLEARFVSPVPSQATLDGSTITMRLDESDEQIAITVVNAINEAFSNMLQDKDLNRCIQGVASKASSPVQNGKPVYGFDNPKFTDFIAPGMIVTISFAQAIGLTSAVFTQDKATGNLDRQWAAGIRPYEIMIGQLLSQFVMLLTQILCLLFVALVIFSLPMDGSIFLVIFLALELGVSGMMYGLTIASNADDQQEATQLALASFFPVLLLSGVIWPREGMPKALQYISYALPTTWAADSMRSIMNRGWDISYPDVYHGFLIVLAWIILLFLWSTRGLRKQTQ